MTGILPGVAQAIDEIRCTFEGCGVEVEDDRSGGAFVVVTGISLGYPYVQAEIWIGFQITFQYPYADVYPHFTNPNLPDQVAPGSAKASGWGHSRAAQRYKSPGDQIGSIRKPTRRP